VALLTFIHYRYGTISDIAAVTAIPSKWILPDGIVTLSIASFYIRAQSCDIQNPAALVIKVVFPSAARPAFFCPGVKDH